MQFKAPGRSSARRLGDAIVGAKLRQCKAASQGRTMLIGKALMVPSQSSALRLGTALQASSNRQSKAARQCKA